MSDIPAWMKDAEQKLQTGNDALPWMQDTTVSQNPPWMQDSTTPVTSSQDMPPWMQDAQVNQPPPWMQDAEQKTQEIQSLPWWYKAVQFGAGALEPLMVFGDFTRSAAYDIFLRKPGERSELGTFFSNLPKYAPWGATPDRVAPGEEFAKRAGLGGSAASIAGIVLEVGMDPLFILDALGTGLARGAAKGASEITRAKLGYEVVTKEEMLRAAKALQDLGDENTASLIRYAAKRELGDKMRSPVAWVPRTVRDSVSKTILRVLDSIPGPVGKEYITEGGTLKQRLSVAESIFRPGYAEGVMYQGTPHGEVAKRLYGFGDATDLARGYESEAVASKLDEAISVANGFAAKTFYLSWKTADEFKKAVGKLPDEVPEAWKLWDKAIADFVDNLSGDALVSREVATTGKLPTVEKVVEATQAKYKLWKRIDTVAKKYGWDTKPLYDAAMDIAKQSTSLAWELGFKLAKMDEFYNVVDDVAKQLGVHPSRVGTAVWRKGLGYHLSKNDEEILNKFYEAWKSGPGSIASIDPETYIKNISQGYMRRMLGLELQDPGTLRKLAENVEGGVRWLATPEMDAEAFVRAIEETVGKEKADELAGFLAAYGDGSLSLQQLEEFTGIPLEDLAVAADRAGASDLGPTILRKVQEALAEADTGVRPRAGLFGKRLFKQRELNEKAAAKYLPLTGISERLAAMGQAGRRALSGQLTLETIYDELVRSGLVYDKPARISSSVDKYGVKLMKVPENAQQFGPLAGKYIPRYAADALITAVQTGDKGWYQKALDNIRVGWLAGPATIARNVWGGATMMLQAGLGVDEIAANAKKALKYLRAVQQTGDSAVLGPGHEVLKLFGEGHMSAEVGDSLDRALREVLVHSGRPLSSRARRVEAYAKKLTDYLTGQPLFSVFQASEDTMRLTTFFAVRDRLVKRGIPIEEAGKLAAQYSNNILFDYASQPEMIRALKKTGLSLFPAFPAFNVARTARLAVTRPMALVSPARFAQASIYGIPEEERAKVSKDVYMSWLRHEFPIVMPGPKPNEFYAYPIRSVLPSLTGFDLDSPITEPLTGGVARAVIDATAAWMNGDGVPPFSSRYGRSVFKRYSSTPEKIGETLDFLGSSYVPGHLRTVRDLAAQIGKRFRATNPDALFEALGDTYGMGIADAAWRTAGVPRYRRGDPTLIEELQGVSYEFLNAYRQLRKDIMRAAVAGDEKELQRLYGELNRWVERERKRLKREMEVPQ